MSMPWDKKSYVNLFPDMKIDGVIMSDFWRAWQISQEFKDNVKEFDTYIFREGDRWDLITERIYGDRKLWWILVLFNDIENPFEIYFDKTIKSTAKSIKIIRKTDVAILLNVIRDKRLAFESQGMLREE